VFLALLDTVLTMPASAPCPEYIAKLESRYEFDATVIRITEALTSRAMVIFADLDQAKFAAKVGANLRPTRLILFGNPKAGTPIMEANPHAALELPLKLIIWQDNRGVTNVEFLDPTALLSERYGIPAPLTNAFKSLREVLTQAIST